MSSTVPAGSPSRGVGVAVYVFEINQPSLPTPFLYSLLVSISVFMTLYVFEINQPSLPTPFLYSVLVSISVFMTLSTVFHSINSSDNSPLSHSVRPVLFLHYWSFQIYISL